MASRYFSEFPEKRISKAGTPPPMGKGGTLGAEAAGRKITERTAAWPSPGPTPGIGFNRKTRAHVVKTTAKRAGLDA